MNKNLEKMLEQKSDNKMEALNFIGKEIEGQHASFTHDKNAVTNVAFQIQQDAKEMQLDIINDKGEVVRSVDLGQKNKGPVEFKWDGRNEKKELADTGRYFYKINGKDMNDQPLKVDGTVKGRVTGVTTSNGSVFLMVGDQKVELKDVGVIREGASKAGPETAVAKKEAGTESVNKDSEASKNAEPSKGPEISIPDDLKSELKKSAENDGDVRNIDDRNSPIPFWYR